MRKVYFIFKVVLCFILFSCSIDNNEDSIKSVIYSGDPIEKEVSLKFNESAINNEQSVVKFIINDDFNFENFRIFVDSTEIYSSSFLISAMKKEMLVNIKVLPKEGASYGNYPFSVSVDTVFGLGKIGQIVTVPGKHEIPRTSIVYPKPKKQKLIRNGIIGFIGLLLISLWLKIKNSFNRGTIQIIEPKEGSFLLKGKLGFNSKKEGCFSTDEIWFKLKKSRNGNPIIISKSKDSILFVNGNIETTGIELGSNYKVVLEKENEQLIFRYI